jgi:hypothetical protein
MIDITSYLPGKRKQTPSGWISFNAPCCTHNGQSADHRLRGGLKASDQGWSFHCFNCGYTASFILGRSVSFRARRLLSWLGVSDNDIEHLNLDSMRHRSVYGIIEDRQRTFEALQGIEFEERELPIAAEIVEPDSEYADYLRKRCVPMDFPFLNTCQNFHQPGVSKARPGIIIPFTYHDKVVGWTTRFLDDRNPRYLTDSQPGYVFNVDSVQDSWTQVLVVEGIFDALSIGGVAVMHNDISDVQARVIRNLGKEITVVPDQDKTGLDLIDRAMELGWAVSIPDWGDDCKDVNDAVKKYGRLATLITIMQARETSRIKIELRKRQLAKRLFN